MPSRLLRRLLEIEQEMGRVQGRALGTAEHRSGFVGVRGKLRMETPELTLPHPEWVSGRSYWCRCATYGRKIGAFPWESELARDSRWQEEGIARYAVWKWQRATKGGDRTMLKIGNVEMNNNVVLAPMAGVCNPAFRLIAKEFGCGLVCAEMVSDKAILHGNKRTMEMLFVDEREKPLSLQIFGGDKESLVEAVKFVDENTNADIIDINMGCPVPKVTKCDAGARWLLDPKKIYEMVSYAGGCREEAGYGQDAHRLGRRAYLCGGERASRRARGRRRG